MDAVKLLDFVTTDFHQSVLPSLMDYVRIPNISPSFDPEWESNGLAEKAVTHLAKWIEAQGLTGCTVNVMKEPKRTHMILAVIEATPGKADPKTVLYYAHCDKQPPLKPEDWQPGLKPYDPIIRGTRLYGRGASDDGYGTYAIIASIKACQKLGLPHDRCVVVIESCEESGSADLGHYLESIQDVIKIPSLMVIMDSGCGDYDRLWMTSSLRGNMRCDFKVQMLRDGVHSGDAGGIVPETFRIARMILDRIDNPITGRVVDAFQVQIPEKRVKQIADAAALLGPKVYEHFPFVASGTPMTDMADKKNAVAELLLNRTWRANMAITGADGLPAIKDAGNVLRPETSLRISLRIPPSLDPVKAKADLEKIILSDPPYGAKFEIKQLSVGPGLSTPDLTPALEKTVTDASMQFYGKEPIYYGEGGSIPFLCNLAQKFPKAQFIITGVLGPESNAHGANEMLELNYTKKIIACLSFILANFHKQP